MVDRVLPDEPVVGGRGPAETEHTYQSTLKVSPAQRGEGCGSWAALLRVCR